MNSIYKVYYKVYYNEDLWRYIKSFNICPICNTEWIKCDWDIFDVNECQKCNDEVLENSWFNYYGNDFLPISRIN
jgi:hypothetical protein